MQTTTDFIFLKLIPVFSIFLTDIWPVANILLTTDTDILKFAYRYFNKVVWLKLVGIAYTRQSNLVNGIPANKFVCPTRPEFILYSSLNSAPINVNSTARDY